MLQLSIGWNKIIYYIAFLDLAHHSSHSIANRYLKEPYLYFIVSSYKSYGHVDNYYGKINQLNHFNIVLFKVMWKKKVKVQILLVIDLTKIQMKNFLKNKILNHFLVFWSLQKLKEKESALKLAEQNILSRDKVINELRLRLPVTTEREKLIAELDRKEVEPKSHHTLKVLQQIIANMQARLNQKEEVIKKNQHLLEKAREVFHCDALLFITLLPCGCCSCFSVKCVMLFSPIGVVHFTFKWYYLGIITFAWLSTGLFVK